MFLIVLDRNDKAGYSKLKAKMNETSAEKWKIAAESWANHSK